ncbi:hypothetical protein B0H14DRAFT_1085940 [Mycena olivaceomarginata]|nr:hypothetical protein B0H14DRAFT_1085940 [Mycena olivaceomarginata]
MTAPSLSASSRGATKTLPRTLRTIPALVVIVRGRVPHDLVHRCSLRDDPIDRPPRHVPSPCVSCFSTPDPRLPPAALVCASHRVLGRAGTSTLVASRRTLSAGACRIPLASASSCIHVRPMIAQPTVRVRTPRPTSCCDPWQSLQCAALD